MTPEQLRAVIDDVGGQAARVGALPDEAEGGAPAGDHFRPVDGRTAGVSGDWVTPIAIRWAPALDLAPADLARVLAERLTDRPVIEAVEVAPSGLLTITLRDADRSAIIDTIREHAEDYGIARGVTYAALAAGLVPEAPGRRDADDPIARAQRSHARLCRLVRAAAATGVEIRPTDRLEELAHVSERRLLVALADLPSRLARHEGDSSAQRRALAEVADIADEWRHPVRPLTTAQRPTRIHGARRRLAEATRIVLRNGLARLGATAPERM